MGYLDNKTIYQKLDLEGMNKYISDFPHQIKNAWKNMKDIPLPTHYINAKSIVVLGMGGCGIAGDLLKVFCRKRLSMPIEVIKDYNLPKYVGSSTLVIGLSYSGTTEETIATFNEAAEKGAKLLAISSGGELESLSRKYKSPFYKINYSSPARAVIGYLFTSLISVLKKLKILELNDVEIDEITESLIALQSTISSEINTSNNFAKQVAEKVKGKIPIIVSSGILIPVGQRFKYQINENSKSFAYAEEIPEMCHNFLQGLDFPEKIKDRLQVIFLQSKYDHPRSVLRFQAVQNILRKKGVGFQIIELECSGSELLEMFYYLHFIDYVSYYLAMSEQADPSPMEMVTYLKKFLEENK